MFPIDPEKGDWDATMVKKFDALVGPKGFGWKLKDLLPKVLPAGQPAGQLTAEGARLLDKKGRLSPGIPFCPPEGDAGTGMVATNAVRPKTGNVSAGTSVFAMIVLEKSLRKVHEEIDIVVTPDGKPVAMAHSNNGSSDFDAWVSLFGQAAKALGHETRLEDLYAKLMPLALKGDPDAGGLLSINYVSGEHVTGFTEGRPLFARKPDSNFTLENFIKAMLYASLCAMRTGMNILTEDEGVVIEEIRGHGGFFKGGDTGQRVMAAALNTPVSLPATAGEGGAWGMALLAAFMVRERKEELLPDYLDGRPEQVSILDCLLMLTARQHDASDGPPAACRLDLNSPCELAMLVVRLDIEACVAVRHLAGIATAPAFVLQYARNACHVDR